MTEYNASNQNSISTTTDAEQALVDNSPNEEEATRQVVAHRNSRSGRGRREQ